MMPSDGSVHTDVWDDKGIDITCEGIVHIHTGWFSWYETATSIIRIYVMNDSWLCRQTIRPRWLILVGLAAAVTAFNRTQDFQISNLQQFDMLLGFLCFKVNSLPYPSWRNWWFYLHLVRPHEMTCYWRLLDMLTFFWHNRTIWTIQSLAWSKLLLRSIDMRELALHALKTQELWNIGQWWCQQK